MEDLIIEANSTITKIYDWVIVDPQAEKQDYYLATKDNELKVYNKKRALEVTLATLVEKQKEVTLLTQIIKEIQEYEEKLKSLDQHNSERRQVQGFNLNVPRLNGIACPNCGEELFDSNPMITLTSIPAQKNVHCTCGYDMKKGETPLDTLRRMERERKFNR